MAGCRVEKICNHGVPERFSPEMPFNGTKIRCNTPPSQLDVSIAKACDNSIEVGGTYPDDSSRPGMSTGHGVALSGSTTRMKSNGINRINGYQRYIFMYCIDIAWHGHAYRIIYSKTCTQLFKNIMNLNVHYMLQLHTRSTISMHASAVAAPRASS